MKWTFWAVVASVMWVNASAQQGPPAGGFGGQTKEPVIGYGKIVGSVSDAGNGEAVAFATVALIDEKTGKTKDGTIADEAGKFVIKNIPEGSFTLQISFIGYKTIEKKSMVFTGKGESVDVGTIRLQSDTKELDEVVVEGQRDLVEEKVDRIIYNAEQDATTSGGDATDVLRRVPLLSVDLDGNVSLRGSSNITVLIDNRPSTISANSIADALKQIPADQIKSVEVITSPSARYDAEGTGGIINIVTKKNNLQGFSMSVNSSAGLRGSNLGLNATMRRGRSGFTLGGFGRTNYNVVGEFENEQIALDGNGSELFRTYQNANSLNRGAFGRYNLGWDYELNKYNWVATSVRFGLMNMRGTQDDRMTQTYEGDALVNENLQDVSTANLSNNVDVSVNYIKTFEKKGKEFSVLTLFSQNTRTNSFENETLDTDTRELLNRLKNDNLSFNREVTVQADYIDPINDKNIIEFGGKNISRLVTSDFEYFRGLGSAPYAPIENSNLNNVFDYRQNVAAGYVSYTTELPKDYSAKAGVRYEYTSIQANFADSEDLNIPAYGVLVPSVNLSKKIGMSKTLKAAYNRRIQRPSLQFLNPNLDASNPNNVSQGNPTLDPEFTNNFEISYSTFSKGNSINISTFMRQTSGSIQAIRETLGQDTIFTTYQNIGEEQAYGLSLFGNFRIGKKFMMNGGVDGYYAILSNNVPDPLYNASNEGFVVSGRVFGSYKLTDKWAFQFFSFFRGSQVQLQGRQAGFYIYSLNLNRSFNDDKGSIGFGAENFFSSPMTLTNEFNSPFLNQTSTNYLYNMNFKINFNYRFGKLSAAQPRRRGKSVENNDLKEGDTGGGQQGGGMMNRP